jgi:AraC-like DNA-binding protein
VSPEVIRVKNEMKLLNGYCRIAKNAPQREQHLRDPKRGIIDAGIDAGFQNPSHFARVFRKLEGTTPSNFRADYMPRPSTRLHW